MLLNMLKAVEKMLAESIKDPKVFCAREIIIEIIKCEEERDKPHFYYKTDTDKDIHIHPAQILPHGLDEEAYRAKKELLG